MCCGNRMQFTCFGTDFCITSWTSYSVTGLKVLRRCAREKKSVHLSEWNSLRKTVSNCTNLACEELWRKQMCRSLIGSKPERIVERLICPNIHLSLRNSSLDDLLAWIICKVEGCFGVVNKFSNFAFRIFIYFFMLGPVPAPLSSTTFPFQCTQLISSTVVPGSVTCAGTFAGRSGHACPRWHEVCRSDQHGMFLKWRSPRYPFWKQQCWFCWYFGKIPARGGWRL